jgi:hypothetical protein
MKTKATHYGTCQLCGSLQKLPSGVLAIHGYQVDWNQFHGTCSGSGHPPFEQSKDLAAETVRGAEKFLKTKPELPYPNVDHLDHQTRKSNPDFIAWKQRRLDRSNCSSLVAFLKPRCANWSVKPLKEVAEEDAKVETVKVAFRNVRQLAALRNDAKSDLSRAIDAVDKIVGYSTFGSITSATCVNVAGKIAASRGVGHNGYRETRFDFIEAMAAASHMLTAHAVWLDAKAAADEAKAAFEADKKAALQARGAAGGAGEE